MDALWNCFEIRNVTRSPQGLVKGRMDGTVELFWSQSRKKQRASLVKGSEGRTASPNILMLGFGTVSSSNLKLERSGLIKHGCTADLRLFSIWKKAEQKFRVVKAVEVSSSLPACIGARRVQWRSCSRSAPTPAPPETDADTPPPLHFHRIATQLNRYIRTFIGSC